MNTHSSSQPPARLFDDSGHDVFPGAPDLETVARRYLDAVGRHDLDAVERLLAPDVLFVGPVMQLKGIADVLEALRRISAVHVRNDVRRVFVDGDEVCVIYDFVTDTLGSLPTVEWLRLANGRIQSVQLYYDQLPWQVLRQQLAARAATPTGISDTRNEAT